MVQKTCVLGVKPEPIAWLAVVAGKRAGTQYRLSRETIIGRDPLRCDFVLDDDAASAEHAKVRYERRRFVLYDLGSTNGTLVNGEKIQRHILDDGDRIVVGLTELVFKTT